MRVWRVSRGKIARLLIAIVILVVTYFVWRIWKRIKHAEDYERAVDEYFTAKLYQKHLPNGVILFDLSKPLTQDKIACTSLKVKPETTICLHENRYEFLTRRFARDGIWEDEILSEIQGILRSDPSYGFIDIGANLGYYSLIVANMGHKVVAVEPLDMNVLRLHKAAGMAHTEKKITLLQNGVSNVRGEYTIDINPDNVGGSTLRSCRMNILLCNTLQTIYMDDLLEFMTFDKAILKMDIEGSEGKAIQKASNLFKEKYIPFVFMEFMGMRRYCYSFTIQNMISFFTEIKYKAFHVNNSTVLNNNKCSMWPNDIVWIKEGEKHPAATGSPSS